MIRWILALLVLRTIAAADDSKCDYRRKVSPSQAYSINSPEYPRKYSGKKMCRWVVDCPTGYNCRLDCPEISIPPSAGCEMDRLLISKNGDLQLRGADTYCGRGSVSATSTGQRITIGLKTSANTEGGRFQCSVEAQPTSSNE